MRCLGIRYWVLGIAVVLLVAGCDGTETPTPTESPLSTPTQVSPLPTPTPAPTETPLPEPTKVPEVVRFEAEAGNLSEPMERGVDGEASACWYVWTEDWGTKGEGEMLATFTVAEAGNYVVWGRVSAPDNTGDSFWVSVDGGAEMLWVVPIGGWVWDAVSNRDGADPVIFSLADGMHVLRVRTREDGAKLDVVEVATADGYVPSEVVECAATPTVESPLASPTPPDSPLVATGERDAAVEAKGLVLLGAAIALVSFGMGGAVGFEVCEWRWRKILKS